MPFLMRCHLQPAIAHYGRLNAVVYPPNTMMIAAVFVLVVLLLQQSTDSFTLNNFIARFHDQRSTLVNQVMKSSDEMFEQQHVMKHLGDYDTNTEVRDDDKIKRDREFLVNMGRAMETLRRELPYAFQVSNLDISIFANQITV
jgi:hypothetical protein